MKRTNNRSNIFKAGIVIVLALALIIPGAASITNIVSKETETTDFKTMVLQNIDDENLKSSKAGVFERYNPNDYSIKKLGEDVDFIFDMPDGDASEPTITRDADGNVVLMWTMEDDDDFDLFLTYAQDLSDSYEFIENLIGVPWSGDNVGSNYDISAQSAGENGEFNGLYIVAVNEEDEDPAFIVINSIVDIINGDEELSFYWYPDDADLIYTDFRDTSVSDGEFYHNTEPGQWDFWGGMSMYSSEVDWIEYGYHIEDGCPWYMQWDMDLENSEGSTVYCWDFMQMENSIPSSPADNLDTASTKNYHMVWDYTAGVVPKIVWKMMNFSVDSDIENTPFRAYLGEGIDPAIAASGDNVAVVFMEYETGNIKCAYSSNEGESWDTSEVSFSGAHPDITMYKDKFLCAYIDGGNLYQTSSSDGGATWSNPIQINDDDGTVIEDFEAVDTHQTGFVWLADIDGEATVVFQAYEDVDDPLPIIEIGEVTGGTGVSFTIKNVGEGDAIDVDYSITIDGGMFGMIDIDQEDTIGEIVAGGQADIDVDDRIIGLGPISIYIEASEPTGSSDDETINGRVFLIFVTLE